MTKRQLKRPLLFIVVALLLAEYAHADIAIDYKTFIAAIYERHPKIQEQAASLRAQEAQIDSARSARLPSIKIGGQYSSRDKESSDLSLSVPVYTFGRISNEIDKEGEKYRLESLRLLDVSNSVIEDATSTYIDYVFQSKKHEVLHRTYKGLALLLERIKRRRDSGYDSMADVNSALSRVLQSEARLQRQSIAIRSLKQEITVLFGEGISEIYPLPQNYFGIEDLDSVAALAPQQNPKILLAEQDVALARRELRSVKLNNRPSIDLYASEDLDNPFSNSSSVGVSLSYEWENLGRAVYADVSTAEHRVGAKLSAVLNAKQEVNITLATVLNEFSAVDTQLAQQASIVASLKKTKKSFSRQYEAGRKSLMELLNIYNELAEAELLALDLERQRIGYQVRLYSLAGAIYLAAITENLPSQLSLLSSGIK